MKLAIVIVLYNKDIKNSTTIMSLSNLKKNDFSVLLFNNGPSLIPMDKECREILNKFEKIEIVQDIGNRPLSFIYNDFIQNFNADSYLILDDDSYITPSLLLQYNNADLSIDLHVPIIRSKSNGEVYYPVENEKVIKKFGVYDFNDSFRTIGSGVLISKCLIDKFELFGGEIFDVRFALYGVDFSLFRRMSLLMKNGVEFKISIVGELEHSLSKVDVVDGLMKNDERYIAMFLAKLIYGEKGFKKTRFVVRELLFYFKMLDFKRCMLISELLYYRCHKRSKKYRNKIK